MSEKKHILLIEDNPEVQENTAEILELAGYDVTTAENGKLGVEAVRIRKPDLIICDIMMPVLDGYGVLHLLSRDSETSGIPFIFLTAKAERSDYRKGMEMGADDYLTKPFDDIELLNALESRLRKSERLKKEFTGPLGGISSFIAEARGIEALKELSEKQEARSYRKKELIFQEDSYPRGLYYVNRGKVKSFHTNENGKELVTGLYAEGDFFGYLDLLREQKYSSSAAALEESEIYLLPKSDFFALVYRDAEVSKRFIQLLTENLHEHEDQLVRLAYNSVRKRVAEALVQLADKYRREAGEQFRMNVSREDLASIAGTATETLIRTLSDFKEEGLVAVSGGNIAVLAYEKLAKMKN